MEMAYIAVLDENDQEKEIISFQFNPSDYNITHTPKYADDKGISMDGKSIPSFLKSGSTTLSLKMTINGMYSADEKKAKDISDEIKKLRGLVIIDSSLHKPPVCKFYWGASIFRGCISGLKVSFTMFTSDGKPVRATADLTVIEQTKTALALESPDRTKRRVLSQDTPLFLVAHNVYGECGEWRRIAAANGIGNPRRVEPGTVLKIPPLEA
jgi:hypothetical protein